jgi:hypothetical protein
MLDKIVLKVMLLKIRHLGKTLGMVFTLEKLWKLETIKIFFTCPNKILTAKGSERRVESLDGSKSHRLRMRQVEAAVL